MVRYDFQYISSKSNFNELILNPGCTKSLAVTEHSYMKSKTCILRSSYLLKNKQKYLLAPTGQTLKEDTVLSESKGAHSIPLICSLFVSG